MQEIAGIIRQGRGRMPPFNSLSDEQVQAVVRYLTKAPQQQQRPPKRRRTPARQVAAEGAGDHANDDMPYKTIGFRRFTDPEGYPATAPPWGTLSAIDLNTGQVSMEDSLRRVSRAGSQGHGRTLDRITTAAR